ncbi:MAG: hypothetical protein AB7J28_15365 [Hyphomonadaceae bacterium]
MTGAVNAVGSGLASIGRAAGSGLDWLGDKAGDIAGGIGRGFSSLFDGVSGTQPMAGTANATQSMLSQGVPDIGDAVGSSGSLTPAGLSGLDLGKNSDALGRALATIQGPDVTDMSTPLEMGSGALTTALQPNAPAASPAAAPTPGAPSMGGNVINFLRRNALPAALIANSVMRGNQTPPEIRSMNALAAGAAERAAAANAGAMAAMNGQLPGGVQASIDQALNAAEATIRSRYAALGMSGSTPEMQELAGAQRAAAAQAIELGQSLARTGFQAAGGDQTLAANLYSAILAAETQRGTQLGDALAEFAAGLVDDGRQLNAPQEAA